MAPAATRDLLPQPCCSSSPHNQQRHHEDPPYPPRDPSSPSSLFRIDMHTHIMPPALPDLAAFTSPPPTSGSTSPDQDRDQSQTQKQPPSTTYAWPRYQTPPPSPEIEEGTVDLYVGPSFFRRVTRSCYAPASRLSDMDAAGVDVQVLSTVPLFFCYDAPVESPGERAAVRALARALNDHVSQVCGEYPGRFVGLGTVPLQDCAGAVEEVRRVRGLRGMVGVQIGTSVEGCEGGEGMVMLDDERLAPFWAECEKLDMPVFVHPLGYALTKENPGRWGKYWSSWLVGMPCETALAMHAVMQSGLLVRHPRLRVCFAHGGGAFPALLGRIQHGFDCRPDLVATKAGGVTPTQHFRGGAVSPGEGLEQAQGQIWVDSLMHDPDLLEYVIRKLGPGGADRIVLGSDYPFPLGEVPMAGKMLVEDARVGRFMDWEQRAGILARNAIRFLNLGDAFEERFEERLRSFVAARSPASLTDEETETANRAGWRHRDSAVELGEDDNTEALDAGKAKTATNSLMVPGLGLTSS